MNRKSDMTCEEFELFGLDSHRDNSLGEECRQRALQHGRICARCSALGASWKAAQEELLALGESTQSMGAPSRVETRVLQQFRVKHQFKQERRTLKFATWSLAAAAILVCAVSVREWRHWRQGSQGAPVTLSNPAQNNSSVASTSDSSNVASDKSSEVLMAGNDSNGVGGNDFTLLPGAFSQEVEEGAIVRVGMPRSALAAFGLPVNEERADDWIQVDVLLGRDGSAQAVRLPQQ
ncbi:MAG TPA: hypothetical protein VGH83_05095 [Candidatus Acidoferrum sp.]|jgi:hypothetical protein